MPEIKEPVVGRPKDREIERDEAGGEGQREETRGRKGERERDRNSDHDSANKASPTKYTPTLGSYRDLRRSRMIEQSQITRLSSIWVGL